MWPVGTNVVYSINLLHMHNVVYIIWALVVSVQLVIAIGGFGELKMHCSYRPCAILDELSDDSIFIDTKDHICYTLTLNSLQKC